MYDNMFAVYRALELYDRAGAAPQHLQLFFKETCNETCHRYHSTTPEHEPCELRVSVCERLKRTLLPALSRWPYLEHGMAGLGRTPVLCFKELIVGLAGYAAWNYDHANIRRFHDMILGQVIPDWQQRVQARQADNRHGGGNTTAGIRAEPISRPLRMMVCNDTSPHAPAGLEEALASITESMPDIMISFTCPHNATFRQQLEHVSLPHAYVQLAIIRPP